MLLFIDTQNAVKDKNVAISVSLQFVVSILLIISTEGMKNKERQRHKVFFMSAKICRISKRFLLLQQDSKQVSVHQVNRDY